MSTKDRLNTTVSKWSLLGHPFYQAWSAGTLQQEALGLYAHDYGTFIQCLPRGWEALGDLETAQEEREHADLWSDFAAALGTRVEDQATSAGARALSATAARLFSDPVTAAGALYAFEVQQPATAQSKLDGLQTHYHLPKDVEPYFEVHSHNEHESAKLLSRMDGFSTADQAVAVDACAEMAQGLWNALSSIYGEDCMH